MSKRQFILYDGRASHGMGTEDSIVLCTCETLKEAKYDARIGEWGVVACYSYAFSGKELTDEKFEFNHFD